MLAHAGLCMKAFAFELPSQFKFTGCIFPESIAKGSSGKSLEH